MRSHILMYRFRNVSVYRLIHRYKSLRACCVVVRFASYRKVFFYKGQYAVDRVLRFLSIVGVSRLYGVVQFWVSFDHAMKARCSLLWLSDVVRGLLVFV